MIADDEDPLLRSLRALPDAALDEIHAERVRRRAQVILAGEARGASTPRFAVAPLLWSRAVVPALLAATVGVYLHFAVGLASSLYR